MNILLVDFKAYLQVKLTLGPFIIRLARMNEGSNQSDANQIVLANKVNPAPWTTLEQVTNKVRRLQILVRSESYSTGEAMCSNIVSAMDELWQGFNTVAACYLSVTPIQSEFSYLGDDENHRPEWSCNWEVVC